MKICERSVDEGLLSRSASHQATNRLSVVEIFRHKSMTNFGNSVYSNTFTLQASLLYAFINLQS